MLTEEQVRREKELEGRLGTYRREIAQLEKSLYEDQQELDKLYSLRRKSVTVDKRESTTVLTRPDGLAVVLNNDRNTYGERHVYWYTGKKGNKVIENCRAGINSLRLWLACYEPE